MENNIWNQLKEDSLEARQNPSPRAWKKLNSLLDQEEVNNTSSSSKKWYVVCAVAASFLLLVLFKPNGKTKTSQNVYVYSMESLNIDHIDNSPLYDKQKIKGLYQAYMLPRVQ